MINGANAILSYKKDAFGEEIFEQFQKWVVFRTIDENWREHLAAMDQLREGIGLRAYGQKNPLIEYKQEGFGMFSEMMIDTNRETLKRIFRSNIQNTSERPNRSEPAPKNLKMQHDESQGLGFMPPPGGVSPAQKVPAPGQLKAQPVIAATKIGRNDPCSCGSGKKYKKCCG